MAVPLISCCSLSGSKSYFLIRLFDEFSSFSQRYVEAQCCVASHAYKGSSLSLQITHALRCMRYGFWILVSNPLDFDS